MIIVVYSSETNTYSSWTNIESLDFVYWILNEYLTIHRSTVTSIRLLHRMCPKGVYKWSLVLFNVIFVVSIFFGTRLEMFSFRDPFYSHGIPAWICYYIPYKVRSEIINSQISTVQPLDFGNGYVIWSHTLTSMWLLIFLELRLIHVTKRGPRCHLRSSFIEPRANRCVDVDFDPSRIEY